MGRLLIALGTGLVFCAFAPAEVAPRTFELNDGRFTELPTTQPAAETPPDATLKRAETLIDRRSFAAARREVLPWLLANRGKPNYDLGLYLMAQAVNGDEDPLKAFYYCDELLDTFPASSYYSSGLELQYQIADSLLSGRRIKVLGVPFLDGTDEAVEMMFRIQQRSPGSPLAEQSLRRTADFYFADGQYDLAADVYGAHARSYPRSPDAPEILLRQAFSNYAQFTGVRFEPTPLVNARAQMTDLIGRYPEVAERENIPAFVDAIDKTLARKLWVTADFYRRTDKPDAANVILNVLVRDYPQSDEAQQARQLLGPSGS
ncbi:MAG TPA: outer membrane protein assembly factor BamD [Tepidisphaeraceae bacterium]